MNVYTSPEFLSMIIFDPLVVMTSVDLTVAVGARTTKDNACQQRSASVSVVLLTG